MISTFIAAVTFVVILIFIVWLRKLINWNFDPKSYEITIALLIVSLFLLLTGRLTKFEIGGFKFETEFRKATKKSIGSQILSLEGLPIESVSDYAKRGVEDIPILIRMKTQALIFKLGYGRYYGPAIQEYLDKLSEFPFLKYIIINDSQHNFAGIIETPEFISYLKNPDSRVSFDDFANWLNESNLEAISQLPNFISASKALKTNMNKKEALEKFVGEDFLPVIKRGNFVGIVKQAQLASSLIIDVTNQLTDQNIPNEE